MSLYDTPEGKLWQCVLEQAVLDAKANNIGEQAGTEKIYKWSRTYDCEEVCFLAGVNHDTIRINIIMIYIAFLEDEEQYLLDCLLDGEKDDAELKKQIAEIKQKKRDVYKRWEKIRCQKL